MTSSRSSRGRWKRVLEARQQSRAALGREAAIGDLFPEPPVRKSYISTEPPTTAAPRPSEAVLVLLIGEAASRLGISRAEMDGLIAAGKVETLKTDFTRVIPSREVQRLAAELGGRAS